MGGTWDLKKVNYVSLVPGTAGGLLFAPAFALSMIRDANRGAKG